MFEEGEARLKRPYCGKTNVSFTSITRFSEAASNWHARVLGLGAPGRAIAQSSGVQDAVFEYHAALACRLGDESYYRKKPVYWDLQEEAGILGRSVRKY